MTDMYEYFVRTTYLHIGNPCSVVPTNRNRQMGQGIAASLEKRHVRLEVPLPSILVDVTCGCLAATLVGGDQEAWKLPRHKMLDLVERGGDCFSPRTCSPLSERDGSIKRNGGFSVLTRASCPIPSSKSVLAWAKIHLLRQMVVSVTLSWWLVSQINS
jgi:hypothetical protein